MCYNELECRHKLPIMFINCPTSNMRLSPSHWTKHWTINSRLTSSSSSSPSSSSSAPSSSASPSPAPWPNILSHHQAVDKASSASVQKLKSVRYWHQLIVQEPFESSIEWVIGKLEKVLASWLSEDSYQDILGGGFPLATQVRETAGPLQEVSICQGVSMWICKVFWIWG